MKRFVGLSEKSKYTIISVNKKFRNHIGLKILTESSLVNDVDKFIENAEYFIEKEKCILNGFEKINIEFFEETLYNLLLNLNILIKDEDIILKDFLEWSKDEFFSILKIKSVDVNKIAFLNLSNKVIFLTPINYLLIDEIINFYINLIDLSKLFPIRNNLLTKLEILRISDNVRKIYKESNKNFILTKKVIKNVDDFPLFNCIKLTKELRKNKILNNFI